MSTINQKPDNAGVILAILITVALFFLLIFCASCRVRKVSTDISKSETKVKTEQSSQVVSKTEITETDKSVTKDSVSDKSETYETDSSTLTADNIEFENGVPKKATGNAKYQKNGNTRKSNDIQSTGFKQADKVLNTIAVKDSSGKFKYDSTNKTKDKVKEVEVKSTSWVMIGMVVALILGILAWFKLSK